MRPFPTIIPVLLVLSACGTDNIVGADAHDTDRDGVPDVADCAPENPSIAGDLDCDGWWDAACEYRLEGSVVWWDAHCGAILGSTYQTDLIDGHYEDCWDAPIQEDSGETCFVGPQDVHPSRCNPQTGDCDEESGVLEWELPGNQRAESCDIDGDFYAAPPCWAYDAIDNDCNDSVDVADYDGDGWASVELGGDDCNDCMATVNPGVEEQPPLPDFAAGEAANCPVYAYDGLDNDCDGADVTDWDEDGYPGGGWGPEQSCEQVYNESYLEMGEYQSVHDLAVGEDCDDSQYLVNPGAAEFCDTVDQDCDGDPLNGFDSSEDGERLVLHVDASSSADEDHATGRDASEAIPSLAQAFDYITICSEIEIEPGLYSDGVDFDLTDLLTSENPDEDALADLAIYIRGADDGVILSSSSGSMLDLELGWHQALHLSDVEVTGAGGVEVKGGSVHQSGVSYYDILSSREAAYVHVTGLEDTLSACGFERNEGILAGGAYIQASTISFADSTTFGSNTAGFAGGGAYLTGFGSASLSDASFADNGAPTSGGGLFAVGEDLNLGGAIFERNQSDATGAGAYVVVEELTGSGTRFDDNDALGGDGGGIFAVAATMDLGSVTASDNTTTGAGGGLNLQADSITLTSPYLSGNVAATHGGGAYILADDANLSLLETVGNEATGGYGGGLYLYATGFGIAGASVGGDVAGFDGGGLFLSGVGTEADPLTLTGLESAGAESLGGRGGSLAISSSGWVDLETVTIACGDTRGATAGGGVALMAWNAEVTDLSIDACQADEDGGGLYLGPIQDATFERLTLTDNVAGRNGGGGYFAASGDVDVTGIDVRDNTAVASGGGLAVTSGSNRIEVDSAGLGTFSGNLADTEGGGWWGGAVALTGGSLGLSELSITGSSAWTQNARGGAVAAYGADNLVLYDVTISSFAGSDQGGCIYGEDARISLSGVSEDDPMSISGCTAGQSGGAIYLANANLQTEYLEVTGSTAPVGATLEASYSVVDLDHTTLDGGTSTGSEIWYSVVTGMAPTHTTHVAFVSSQATMDYVQICDNATTSSAGHIHTVEVDDTSFLDVRNTLFCDNDGTGLMARGPVDAEYITSAGNGGSGVVIWDDASSLWYSALAENDSAGLSATGDGFLDMHCVYSGDNGGNNLPEEAFYDTYRSDPTYVCDGDEDGNSASFDSDWVTTSVSGDCGECPWIPPFGMTYIPHCITPGYVYQTSGSGPSCF